MSGKERNLRALGSTLCTKTRLGMDSFSLHEVTKHWNGGIVG